MSVTLTLLLAIAGSAGLGFVAGATWTLARWERHEMMERSRRIR